MAEPDDLRGGLERLAGQVTPATGSIVIEGARHHRRRRHRRRRAAVTGVSVAVVVVLVAAALVIPRGDDTRDGEGITADDGRSSVVLPVAPSEAVALAGDDEAVWVLTSRPGSGDEAFVVRVEAERGEVTATGAVTGSADLIAVSDDGVWVTGHDADVVTRLDRDTLAVMGTIPIELVEPWCSRCIEGDGHEFQSDAIAIAGGRPWVRSPHGEVLRIDPNADEVDARLNLTAAAPGGMAGSDDALWVTAGDHLVQIDPETAETIGPLAMADLAAATGTYRGVQATDISIAGGYLWVSTANPIANPGLAVVVVDPGSASAVASFGPPVGAIGSLPSLGVGDDDEAWIVDGTELYRVPNGTPFDEAMPAGTVGLPRPATVASGDYWYLSAGLHLARVRRGAGDRQLVEVVTDPTRSPAPDNECSATLTPSTPFGPDALPRRDSTRPARVARILESDRAGLLAGFGALDAAVVPRNAYVWERVVDSGRNALVLDAVENVEIVLARDDQIELTLTSTDDCPAAPTIWNGIPLTFTLDDPAECVAPPEGFDGDDGSIERLTPEELQATREPLDEGQSELLDQMLKDAANDRHPVVASGGETGFISNRTRELPSGEIGPVVDEDGCLVGYWGGSFIEREVVESADFAIDRVVDIGEGNQLLASDAEQTLVPLIASQPSGRSRFMLDPVRLVVTHVTEFVDCVVVDDQRLCDPDIGQRELHIDTVQGQDSLTLLALLPDEVDRVLLDTAGVDFWQEVSGSPFAVLHLPWTQIRDARSGLRLIGLSDERGFVFAEAVG